MTLPLPRLSRAVQPSPSSAERRVQDTGSRARPTRCVVASAECKFEFKNRNGHWRLLFSPSFIAARANVTWRWAKAGA